MTEITVIDEIFPVVEIFILFLNAYGLTLACRMVSFVINKQWLWRKHFFPREQSASERRSYFCKFLRKESRNKKQKKHAIKWMNQVFSTIIWLFWITQQVRNLTASLTPELPCTRAPCACTSGRGWYVSFVSSPLPPAGLSGSTTPRSLSGTDALPFPGAAVTQKRLRDHCQRRLTAPASPPARLDPGHLRQCSNKRAE